MNSFFELASTRRSIRKFENRQIPEADIEYFIKSAVTAPSGCNSQCWKFAAIQDRNVIGQIVKAVTAKVDDLLLKGEVTDENYLSSKKKMVSFFAKAPVVIAVFMTKADFYDTTMIEVLKRQGYNDAAIMHLFADYDVLSIGAAVQNLLLAVHEKGYGACWMNEPAIAGIEINKLLGEPEEHRFISLIPIGVPAYTPREKKMKDLDEIYKYI